MLDFGYLAPLDLQITDNFNYNFQECVNISTLSHIKTCSATCRLSGGVCNNNGNCHCPVGRACPYCELAGPGGSADSGQGCVLHDSCEDCFTPLAKAMLVLFLLVLPVAVLFFIVYKNWGYIRDRFLGGRVFSVPTLRSSRGVDDRRTEVVSNTEVGSEWSRVMRPVAGGGQQVSSKPSVPSRPAPRGVPPSRPPRPPANVRT